MRRELDDTINEKCIYPGEGHESRPIRIYKRYKPAKYGYKVL